MAAPDSIYQLVEKFNAQHAYYTSPQYNETQVRVEFINPFFHALGWDVSDSQHVIHEAMVYVEENARMKPKHPDYAFLKNPRISGSGTPDYAFFLEAKAPHVDVRGGVSPAYQVRRYGWSARLPASALTDFEEFSLYDCRVRPNLDDNPRKDRLLYFTFRDYVDQWDTLFDLFSYEAVRDNQLDAYVRGKGERGASTVDDAFLRDLEAWRVMLAKHIALHNPGLTRRDINMAVQLTIDRIVFLRICEDRGIEAYGRLRDLQNSPAIYSELAQFFRQADARYNSGLFHFSREPGRGETDEVTLGLTIPNEPLNAILNGLYYPVSPYEFSVLPAEILGQVYERFLGSVIELSEGGLAQVVEKPEVRKAGGVYYTPTYIVEYIVANTVGVLLEGVTPDEAAKLRILDPACGSGSFLIGAYQYLLDWHLNYYVEKAPRGYLRQGILRETSLPLSSEAVKERGPGGEVYALTTGEKKRILLNNIYGVDLDQQAVEVSKLSLLLKMLEGETAASTGSQLQLIGERILPDLSDNIKWGNSLIGPDFYEGKQLGMFDDEALYKVKVFDWHNRNEGFGVIMAKGGFDAVIGNPPYIRIQTMQETAPETVPYYSRRYRAAQRGNYDIYVAFVERGLELLNPNGRLGFILPHKFFNAQYGEPLRGLIAGGQHLSEVVHFGDQQVFDGATTYTCLMFLKAANDSDTFNYTLVEDLDKWSQTQVAVSRDLNKDQIKANEWIFVVGEGASLFSRLRRIDTTLADVTDRIFQGLVTSADAVYLLDPIDVNDRYVYVLSKQTSQEYMLEREVTWPLVKGSRDVRRYRANPSKYVLFPYDPKVSAETGRTTLISAERFEQDYPSAWNYLMENRQVLEDRERGKMRHDGWYGYVYPKSVAYFGRKKILTPSIASEPSFTLDTDGSFYFVGSGGGGGGGYGIILSGNVSESYGYILGLLNSKLSRFFMEKISSQFRGGYYAYSRQYIEQLPIRTINFDDAADVARHDRMVALVGRMLDLHQQIGGVSGQAEKVVRAQIESTDREIDTLVYALYGLTDEEIAVVEVPG